MIDPDKKQQAEFVDQAAVAESHEAESQQACIKYDEWNFSRQAYRSAYCAVFPSRSNTLDTEYYHQTIRDNRSVLIGLRKLLANVNNRNQQMCRQMQGNAFDIDAVADLFADIHAGMAPDAKVCVSDRKKEKDISILLLLDASLSSDGYAAGNRVIDVEKQVSILFGEILHDYDIDF